MTANAWEAVALSIATKTTSRLTSTAVELIDDPVTQDLLRLCADYEEVGSDTLSFWAHSYIDVMKDMVTHSLNMNQL